MKTATRIFNLSAGPATLPVPVLEQAQRELLALPDIGMSILEVSHRSRVFENILAEAEANIRALADIPSNYRVLFLQGGASLQFSMVPMNLLAEGATADYLVTGVWATKAADEARRIGNVHIAATTKAEQFSRVPRVEEIVLTPGAAYVHMTSNETIEGVEFKTEPGVGDVPLVADMSSNILSKPIPVEKYGLIYAGAQKNMGPAGVTIVIVRKDLAERADKNLPTTLQYRTYIKEKSLYNTPPTFAVYIVGLVMEWMDSEGGLSAIQKRNEAKAKLLYDTIDTSDGYFKCPVEKDSRSRMNVVFRIAGGDEAVEKEFARQAEAAGLVGSPGHRSVGGMRISLYNAVELPAVEALTGFLKDFQRKRG